MYTKLLWKLLRMWRNWYTRTLEVRVAQALRVRVSPSALLKGDFRETFNLKSS